MTNEQKIKIVRRAAELIRKGWTKERLAANADGAGCFSNNPEAVSWCADGAVNRAIHDLGFSELDDPVYLSLRRFFVQHTGLNPVEFNDNEAVVAEDVAGMFDAYVEELEKQND